MASSASKLTIDNETWQAIREGRVDLSHASPALRIAAREIGFGVSRKRGFFERLFGGDHRDSWDGAELKMAEILVKMENDRANHARAMEAHDKWVAKTRLQNVPVHYHLISASSNGHSYSDGRGNIIHYNANGSKMSAQQEQDYLDRTYGPGD